MGSHVRVGLEDGLFIGRGQLAESNAEQVAKIRRILTELSHRDRDPGGGSSDPRAQGPRPGRLVSAGRARPRRGPDGQRSSARASSVAAGPPHFLRSGYDVVAWDPGPTPRHGLLRRSWTRLAARWSGSGSPPAPAGTGCAARPTLEEALAGTDFVQESSPEVLDAKRRVSWRRSTGWPTRTPWSRRARRAFR